MSSELQIVASLATELLAILKPIDTAIKRQENLSALLSNFGWQVPAGLDLTPVASRFDLSADLDTVANIIAEIADGEADDLSSLIGDAIDVLTGAYQNIQSLSRDPVPAGMPAPFDSQAFWTTFPLELLEHLTLQRLSGVYPMISALLELVGVIDMTTVPAAPPRTAYQQRKIRLERLVKLLTDPPALFREVYHWDDPAQSFRHSHLLENICRSLSRLRPIELSYPREGLADEYYSANNPVRGDLREVSGPIFTYFDPVNAQFSSFDVSVFPIPRSGDQNGPPAGFMFGCRVSAEGAPPVELISNDFIVTLKGGFESEDGLRVEVLPGSITPRLDSNGTRIAAEAALRRETHHPQILLGAENASRIQIKGLKASLGVAGQISDPEILVGLELEDLEFVLQLSAGDGFLQKILGDKPQSVKSAIGALWSSKSGITFRGGTSVALTIGLHQELGPVLLESITLGVTAKTDPQEPLELTVGVTGGFALGPIAASVDRIGVRAILKPVDQNETPGMLGNFDLAFGFKPPDGVGMALDAQVVAGGGYILFNPEEEQYAGILQLEVEGMFSIKAIALLTTRVPGLPPGVKGFSLLVILTAEFPPIQLGYGFALLGVGGLFGANRTMMLDPLRDGIKNHTVDSILFPENPVENAQQIISDLRAIFPPADGRFVLGPMIKLSWGTPPIITGELGILLELPAPVRVAILGTLRLALPPVENAEVLVLQMDVIGALDFDRSDASIDATLVDSRVAVFPITGDMAMRLNWGASPMFALAAGGFHPCFEPPPGFPALSRLAISLATGDNPRLRLEAYMAITASTAMTGARLDVYAERDFGEWVGVFSVSACLGFDALVQFSPFSFVIDMGGGASLKHNGHDLLALTLSLTLTGPQPWHALGEARFEFLGKHRIGFDVTVGEEAGAVPEIEVSPLDELVKALSDPHAWSAQLPDDRHMLATVRQIAPSGDEVLVHPLGSLSLRQRVVPLGLELEKYGEANISGDNRYDFDVAFTGASAASAGLTKQPVHDHFTAAQYFEMSDDEKLSRPAFESFPSGYRWTSGGGVSAGGAIRRPFGYETVVIDEKDTRDRREEETLYTLHDGVLKAASLLGAAARSAMRSTGGARFAGPAGQKVTVGDTMYALVNKSDLKKTPGVKSAITCTEAGQIRRRRRKPGGVQVVGSHEARTA